MERIHMQYPSDYMKRYCLPFLEESLQKKPRDCLTDLRHRQIARKMSPAVQKRKFTKAEKLKVFEPQKFSISKETRGVF